MKVFSTALYALTLVLLVSTTPTGLVTSVDLALRPRGDILLSRIPQCIARNALVTSLSGERIYAYFAFLAGPVAALSVYLCTLFGTDCSAIVHGISMTLTTISLFIYMVRNGQLPTGAIAGGEELPQRRELGAKMLRSQLEKSLRERGLEFESINHTPVLAARSDDKGLGSTRFSLLGVRDPTLGTAAVDHLLYVRDDGTGMMTLRPTPRDGPAAHHSTPGLLISWNVIQDDGAKLGISKDTVSELTDAVGSHWLHQATVGDGLQSYIGSLGLGPGKELGFRITIDENAFDENYEDVLGCGSLGHP
ncbi:hypothetical protein GQ53DRAFT_817967 [Thozetella sp. PMI_491]|nr:hypothetical protein GQ53DRAFT_817967 [Thozetella sp. PMI_491]